MDENAGGPQISRNPTRTQKKERFAAIVLSMKESIKDHKDEAEKSCIETKI